MSDMLDNPFAGMPPRTSEGKKELHSADGESYVMQVSPGQWKAVFQGVLLGTPRTREQARDLVRDAKRKAGIQWNPGIMSVTIAVVQPRYAVPFGPFSTKD